MESITRVGIDVCLAWLDLRIERPHAKKHRFKNDLTGVGQLKALLGKGNYVIAIESTGRYESLARHELEAAGYDVRVKNPRQMRKLAEGLGYQAKTDELDAKVLAETAELGKRTSPRSKEREALGDISRTINTLKKGRADHLKRMQVPGVYKGVIAALKAMVKAIDAQVQKLEKEFVQLVKKSSLAKRHQLALSVEGVGPVLARIVTSELPDDLDNWSIRQISSYAGVSVIDDTSGTQTNDAKVPSHGNIHLKSGLYMPAMALIARVGWAKNTYSRLRAKGKSHQQAIVAVMHKLLIHIAAVLKRGTPWQGAPTQKA